MTRGPCGLSPKDPISQESFLIRISDLLPFLEEVRPMAQRWIIHSRDRTLGPWTGAQVRDELRAGRIDPFDMVSQENSSIKRPLVEVDDIFQSSRVQMAEIIQEEVVEAFPERDVQEATAVSRPQSRLEKALGEPVVVPAPPLQAVGAPVALVQPAQRPRQFQALAAEARVAPQKPNRKSGEKNYFITDSTGRSYGPLSSHDVMEMWQRGIIDARSIVQRRDQPRKISIQKFVSFYERSAPSGIAFLPEENQLRPGYRYASKDSSDGLFAMFVVLLTCLALGFLGHTLYQSRKSQLKRGKEPAKSAHRFDLKANEDLAGRIAPVKRPIPKVAEPRPNPAEKVLSNPVPRSSGVKRGESLRTPRPNVSTAASPTTQRTTTPAKPRALPSRVSVPRSAPQRSSSIRTERRRQPVKRVSAPRPRPVESWEDGKTVTLSGYTFSASALGVCEGKCKLPMSGANGPITAVFFKQAYGSALANRGSGAAVSGILRKSASGDWQIIVSSVR